MQRSWWMALFVLGGVCVALVAAQSSPWQLAPVAGDFDTQSGLARGLLTWLVVLPHQAGGPVWYPVVGKYPATLTNMGASSGWGDSLSGWGYGTLRHTDSDDYLDLGVQAAFDFENTTFSVSLDVEGMSSPTPPATAYLVAKHNSAGFAGGYVIRSSTAGVVLVRLYNASNSSAGERSTVGLNLYDGKKHTLTVVFKTDTVTLANNDVTLYVDGRLDQTTTLANDGAGGYGSCVSCALRLGMLSDGVGPMVGRVLGLRLYERGLSAAEAAALAAMAPPTFGDSFLLPPLNLAAALAPAAFKRKVVTP